MKHVTYALFQDTEHARSAVDGIESSGTPREHCGVVLHKDRLDDGLAGNTQTAASEGMREGAAIGAILGAVAAAIVMGPMGLVSGGVLGAAYGGVGGAIAGSGTPDRTLEKLSRELAGGKILLVVEAPSLACRDKADVVMRSHGGQVEHKPFF